MPKSMHRDLVYKIARYIDPDPVVYTRLAAVNKEFYAVFTSDNLWSQLDVYDKRTEIFIDFMQRLPGLEMLFTISRPGTLFPGVYSNLVKSASVNKYLQLMLISSIVPYGQEPELDITDKHFLAILAQTSPNSIAVMNSLAQDDETIVLNAFRGTVAEYYISDRLNNSKEFAEKLEAHGYYNNYSKAKLLVDPQGVENLLVSEPTRLLCLATGPLTVQVERQSVLHGVEKEPMVLDLFPEYWQDTDMCLAALDAIALNTRPDQEDTNYTIRQLLFLNNQHQPVVDKIVKVFPDAIAVYPSHFRNNKDLFMHHLQLVDRKYFKEWFNAEKRSGLLQDLEVFKVFLTRSDFHETDAKFLYSGPLLEDFDWFKDRIDINPKSWIYASPKLKGNKELFMTVASLCRSRNLTGTFKLKHFPRELQEDPDILKGLVILGCMNQIPKPQWTADLVMKHFELYPNHTIKFSPLHYEIAREVVLQNPRHIVYAEQFLDEFINDPCIAPFIAEHRFEIWVYIEYENYRCGRQVPWSGHGALDKFIIGDDGACPGLTREIATRVIRAYPELYGNNEFWQERVSLAGGPETRWFDKEFVLGSVAHDPSLFWQLPTNYVFSHEVQTAAKV